MTRNWAEILGKPMPDSPTAAQMLSYVKGYIMALEDILRDIGQGAVDSEVSIDYCIARNHIRDFVEASLREARQTLEHLE